MRIAAKLKSFEDSLERDGQLYDPRYFCLRTKGARFDAVAAESLKSYGMPVLFPRIKEVVKDRNDRSYEKTSALFPGYLFARFDLRYFRSLGYVHGVATLVGHGSMPEEVAGEVIDEILSRIQPDGFVRLDKRGRKHEDGLKAGDRVEILEGPLAGLIGAFVEGLSDGQRVKILLESIYFSTMQPHVNLPREAVSRLQVH